MAVLGDSGCWRKADIGADVQVTQGPGAEIETFKPCGVASNHHYQLTVNALPFSNRVKRFDKLNEANTSAS